MNLNALQSCQAAAGGELSSLFGHFCLSFSPQVKDFGAPHGLYAMVAVLRFLLLGEKVTPFLP